MSVSRVLFSSQSGSHATPSDLYATLDSEFGFTLDPCPLTERDGEYAVDGLALSWKGQRVFCNPPYGRGIGAWLAKAAEADVAVFLLPARTDTKWWHEYQPLATETRFVKGRLRFGNAKAGAPFPSVILVFHAGQTEVGND